MRVFFDSSSFAKRYSDEHGTIEVEEICANASELILSALVIPEIISSLIRKKRDGVISNKDYLRAKTELYNDTGDATILNITLNILDNSIELLEKYTLRTLDAIHMASVIECEADLFVTSDKRQYNAALKAGIPVKFI